MPSPFPGMDPFIESQEWTDFHTRFITVIGEFLAPPLRKRYIVRVERRVYVEHATDDLEHVIPDLAVVERPGARGAAGRPAPSAATPTAPLPVECLLPMPEERREAFLVIRGRHAREVVTVIELLSPGNKTPGSDGFREYRKKRETVLQSPSHLVELDLLPGGKRLPTINPLPDGDYYAFVCRRQRRPRAEVYAWTIRDPLPSIPVPLAPDDPDGDLDLQAVFATTYDRAAYDDSIDYSAELHPPLGDDTAAFARRLVEPE